ncbi:hypothetical protein LCGC14_1659940 [marine sediment metagenome]|uniref:Uncharacterized protein n=1 Tax=marine sediment metagenome TaxID=412755 RepID=A0A0F9HV51_9ZZZZ
MEEYLIYQIAKDEFKNFLKANKKLVNSLAIGDVVVLNVDTRQSKYTLYNHQLLDAPYSVKYIGKYLKIGGSTSGNVSPYIVFLNRSFRVVYECDVICAEE